MITMEVEDADLTALAKGVRAASQREGLMLSISRVMWDAVEENFAQEGRPKWQGLKPPGRSGKILQKSGRLASSIAPASDADSATVGTNVVYAAIHQFGGQTRPHVIRPRNKKALAFGGKVYGKVNHPGSKIPARPFLVLAEDDSERIEETVEDYLMKSIGNGS